MSKRKRRVWPVYILLVASFVGTLWVPFYNSVEPRLGGVPYFYWYQFLWIGISAALTAIVYFATREADSAHAPAAGDAVVERLHRRAGEYDHREHAEGRTQRDV